MGARCCKEMFGGDDSPPPSPSNTAHYQKFPEDTAAARHSPPPHSAASRTPPDTFAGFSQTCPTGACINGRKTPIAKSCSTDSVDDKKRSRGSVTSTKASAAAAVAPPVKSSGGQMLDSTAVVCLLGAGAFGSVSLVFQRTAELTNHSIRRTALGHAQSSTDLTAPNRTITSPTDCCTDLNSPNHVHIHHRRSQSQGHSTTLGPHSVSPALMRPPHGSVEDLTTSLPQSQTGSFASNSFAAYSNAVVATGSSMFNPPHTAAVVRFSVLKRISKAKQAQFGNQVDLAADRFSSARLRHPNIVKLLQAGRTNADFLNMYEFALGADVAKMLSRKQSIVRDDMKKTWPQWDEANQMTRCREFNVRCGEPQPAPLQCTCTALWSSEDNRHTAQLGLPIDTTCPVLKWSATRAGLPLSYVALTAFELLAALHYLATHPNRFVHGDVKPDNVFITERGHLQLGDFSTLVQLVQPAPPSPQKGPVKKSSNLFSRSKRDEDSNSAGGRGSATSVNNCRGSPDGGRNTSFAGQGGAASMQAPNPKYNPPEVIEQNGLPRPSPAASPAQVPEPTTDMWSYGVSLLELATGLHPFFPMGTEVHARPALAKVMKADYVPIPEPLPHPISASSSAYPSQVEDGLREAVSKLNDLISQCLVVQPTDRITASSAIKHSFFRHPLVLTHLGVNPMDVALDAADYLVNQTTYASREDAESQLLFENDDGTTQVDWNNIENTPVLRDAFSLVLWTQYVVHATTQRQRLRPSVIPAEMCVNGGFSLPDAANLSLSGNDLITSFCTSDDGTTTNTMVTHFGDSRLPPFVPVDLRFFTETQAEFDSWTDEKNKRRLARTDAELRADSHLDEPPAVKVPAKRSGGAPPAPHHVDQQVGYTYNPGNTLLAN